MTFAYEQNDQLMICRCVSHPVSPRGSASQQYATGWDGKQDEYYQSSAEKPVSLAGLIMGVWGFPQLDLTAHALKSHHLYILAAFNSSF